ncbi:MAG: hypothetical protein A2340_00160 [Lentisphaerae bacterium RIFOXYB12_FULL_60_10]|nr:MAG: hypothetical protein A2340_00160 [Lentisphaerae bacterium RIFOXYB12_FULL_60_10]
MNPDLHITLVVVGLDGGTGTFCRTVARGFQQVAGASVSLVHIRPLQGPVSRYAGFDQIRSLAVAVDASKPRRIGGFCLSGIRLKCLFRQQAVGRILSVGPYSNILSACVFPRRQVIMTEHSAPEYMLMGRRMPRITRGLMRAVYARHQVVGVSDGISQSLRRLYGLDTVETVYNGIDLDDTVRRAGRIRPDDLPVDPYWVTSCRLTPEKDLVALLDAYAVARQRGMREHLVVVGDGPERAHLVGRAVSLGIASNVHFVGWKENPLPYVAHASGFVLTSRYEAFGYALLEAMALRVPGVAVDCPTGPRELLAGGRYGLLVPVDNPVALADAMHSISVSADRRRQLTEAGFLRAQDFDCRKTAKSYLDIWNRMDAGGAA